MTPDNFRRIALSMPEAMEAYRRGRSEFRVERRMFAALEGPADSVALLNLSAEQQLTFLQVAPAAFVAAPGGWGRLGSTTVVLAMAEEPAGEVALWAAWRNVASKSLLKRIEPRSS